MSSNIKPETINAVLADAQSDERDVRAATAPHQRDFPYERDEEAQVTRREFCNFLGLTSASLFLASAGFSAKAVLDARREPGYTALPVEGARGLPPGAALNFRYPTERDTAILVRTRDGEYYAYGQKCTHLSCPVYYDRGDERFECPCHEGAFDARTGAVLYGPPPRPLDRIAVEVREDGEVWAVGRKAGGEDEHTS